MKYSVQVNKQHYDFTKYVNLQRWNSYYHQIHAVVNYMKRKNFKKISVLEIGIGDKAVSTFLKLNNVNVKTLDVDKELQPDFVDALPDLKTQMGKNYDIVLCCEVLEHIQLEDVETSLKRMGEISNNVIISVPHKGMYLSISMHLWFIKKLFWCLLLPSPNSFRKLKFNGEHYWEIGMKNFNTKKFIDIIDRAGFKVLKHYRVPEYLYHHMFYLEKK